MTDADAMLRIDMLGHDFFLYEDSTDGQPSVMYRRHDGGYGILHGIKPQDVQNIA
jgi:putative sigma-54 modulation protein